MNIEDLEPLTKGVFTFVVVVPVTENGGVVGYREVSEPTDLYTAQDACRALDEPAHVKQYDTEGNYTSTSSFSNDAFYEAYAHLDDEDED